MRTRVSASDLKGFLPVAPLAASISTVMLAEQVTNRTIVNYKPYEIPSDLFYVAGVAILLMTSVALLIKGVLECRRRPLVRSNSEDGRRPSVRMSNSEDITLL